MVTPQKRAFPGLWLTPKSENQRTAVTKGLNSGSGKGKTVAFLEYENGRAEGGGDEGRGLRETVAKLENELFEYQYNMGLLVIEKKELSSKYEELQRALEENKDAIKREHAAHLAAITAVEKREEGLRKALGVEKQCVIDLEKALREMRNEYAEIRYTADSKLTEAKALEASIEEKLLEVEAKMRAVDGKLAEANRKSSEVDRKMHEVEVRENSLRREWASFNSEREAHEATMSRQREDLLEWESRLQAVEERINETRRILDQKEERVSEFERSYKQKEKDLEAAHEKIDLSKMELVKKEENISNRLASLSAKEKDVEATQKRIEKKEKDLLVLEEMLNKREKDEIQKQAEEHKKELDAKKEQFDLEISQRRRAVDDEVKSKTDEVEKKEIEVRHMEEKVAKREAALEKRSDKLKDKEKEFESKSKDLKEKEKSIRAEEKKLESEKKDVLTEKLSLLGLKEELEQRKSEIEEQLLKIQQEREHLKVTEEERSEHLRLQSELKEEINKYRVQKEVLMKEADALKEERESFEKEWEALDEKKAAIDRDLKNLTAVQDKFERWRRSEEERLKNESMIAQTNIEKELKELELAKEAFAAEKAHKEKILSERAESERTQLMNDFEMRKRKLEMDTQKELEDKEKLFHESQRLFEEEREMELGKINKLREVAERGMNDLGEARRKLDKQKEELAANKRDIERYRLDIEKDIQELVILNGKVKDNREQFLKEKECLIAFLEKLQSCENCREIIRSFVFSNQSMLDMESPKLLSKPVAETYVRNGSKQGQTPGQAHIETSPEICVTATPKSGGKLSWLLKCASLFSPSNKNENSAAQNVSGEPSLVGQQANVETLSARFDVTEDYNESSSGFVNDSLDVERMQSDVVATLGGVSLVGEKTGIHDEKHEEAEASEISGFSRGPRAGKRGRLRGSRTRSMKAVVKEAKAILGDTAEENQNEHPNGYPQESESSFVDRGNMPNEKKRNRAQNSQTTASLPQDDSEGDSMMAGGRRKRRQKVELAEKTQPVIRYNLRTCRNVGSTGPGGTSSKQFRDKTGPVGGSGTQGDSSSKATFSAGAASENDRGVNLEQAKAQPQDDAGNTTGKKMEHGAVSKEVNGTPDRTGERDGTPDADRDHQGEESEGDEDEDEPMHPGETSIGKKLWTFFTT